ncbi:hypothetical protein JTB14_018083 [Gonioctena quinquepunctata]|nr:hypothetical protein JTB14_018083 [Gonioctena quinquepunctata]
MSFNGRAPPRIEGMISLKVDNLTYRTTVEDLRRAFERCGEVGDIYIPRDRFTRESRGFAFVRFYDKRDAEDALDAMDGHLHPHNEDIVDEGGLAAEEAAGPDLAPEGPRAEVDHDQIARAPEVVPGLQLPRTGKGAPSQLANPAQGLDHR